MTRTLRRALLAVALASAAAECAAQPSLDQLYREARWFELRDAIEGRDAPPLYRAVVASAFNRADEAERALKSLVRDSSDETAGAAVDALLSSLRTRRALRRRAGACGRRSARFRSADLRNVVACSARRTRNQRCKVAPSLFECTVGAEGVHLPITVNGHPVRWLLDTGANVTVTSEAEALARHRAREGRRRDRRWRGWNCHRSSRRGPARHGRRNGAPGRGDDCFSRRPAAVGRARAGHARYSGAAGRARARDDTLDVGRHLRGGTGQPRRRTGRRRGTRVRSRPRVPRSDAECACVVRGQAADVHARHRQRRGDAALAAIRGGLSRARRAGHEIQRSPRSSAGRASTKLRCSGGRPADRRLRHDAPPANVFAPPVGNGVSHGNLGMDLLSRASEITLDFRSMVMVIR